MTKSNELSISEAAKWLLKVASANGSITPEAQQVIDDFAEVYGLEMQTLVSEQKETAPKPLRTKQDLFRELRYQENKRLELQIKNPAGSDYFKERVEIELPDGSRISEPTNIASYRLIYAKLGFQNVADANIKYKGRYPLVSLSTKSAWYVKEGQWYILSNISTKWGAICLNKVFDALNVCMIARVITR